MTDRQKPLGKDQIRTALLDAADALFGEKGPSTVSVREISALANVNHALLHRHFGSKQALLAALIEQHRQAISSGVARGKDVRAATTRLFDGLCARPAFARMFAFLVLDRQPLADFVSRSGGTGQLAAQLMADGVSEPVARQMAATLSAFCFGWAMFKDLTVYAAGVNTPDTANDDFARSALLAMLAGLLETAEVAPPPTSESS